MKIINSFFKFPRRTRYPLRKRALGSDLTRAPHPRVLIKMIKIIGFIGLTKSYPIYILEGQIELN